MLCSEHTFVSQYSRSCNFAFRYRIPHADEIWFRLYLSAQSGDTVPGRCSASPTGDSARLYHEQLRPEAIASIYPAASYILINHMRQLEGRTELLGREKRNLPDRESNPGLPRSFSI
jgi:hypothetical protein